MIRPLTEDEFKELLTVKGFKITKDEKGNDIVQGIEIKARKTDMSTLFCGCCHRHLTIKEVNNKKCDGCNSWI